MALRSSVPSLPVAVATSPCPRIPGAPLPRFSVSPLHPCTSRHGSPDLRRPSARETPARLPATSASDGRTACLCFTCEKYKKSPSFRILRRPFFHDAGETAGPVALTSPVNGNNFGNYATHASVNCISAWPSPVTITTSYRRSPKVGYMAGRSISW